MFSAGKRVVSSAVPQIIAATLKPSLLDVAEKQMLHLIVKRAQVVILDLHGVRSSKMDDVILDRPLIATDSSNQIPSG